MLYGNKSCHYGLSLRFFSPLHKKKERLYLKLQGGGGRRKKRYLRTEVPILLYQFFPRNADTATSFQPAEEPPTPGEGPLVGGGAGRWHQTASLLPGFSRASPRGEGPPPRTAPARAARHGGRDLLRVCFPTLLWFWGFFFPFSFFLPAPVRRNGSEASDWRKFCLCSKLSRF